MRSMLLVAVAAALLLLVLTPPSLAQTIEGKFYEYEILARSGQTPLNASQALTGMAGPSINSNGTVAFFGQFTGGEGVVAASPSLPATLISFAPPSTSRSFGSSVQINDATQVLASDFLSGSPPSYYDRLWYVKQPGSFKTLIRGGSGQPFSSVLSNGSVNAKGDAVIPALDKHSNSIIVSVQAGTVAGQLQLPSGSFPFPQIADTGSILVRLGNQPNSPIVLYDQMLSIQQAVIADSTKFDVLGNQPGISADGLIVAFYGQPNAAEAAVVGSSPGIFAVVDEGGIWSSPHRITGLQVEVLDKGGNDDGICDPGETCEPAAELGYDDFGISRYFSSYANDSRVAVTNLGLGAAGIDDDSFVISFIATPTGASRTNPVLGNGIPLLFSSQQGLWTIRVDVQHQLSPPNGRVYHPKTAIPVVQLNDQIGIGNTISSISVFNQLANAAEDDTGKIRTMRRGDHRIVFLATTAAGQQVIVRGSHLDSDQDGLLDHWETSGIDMDQDGIIDLNLHAMGANPNKRDLFLEVDWLADQPTFSFQPLPGVISGALGEYVSNIENMFTGAPVLTGNQYGARSDGAAPANIPLGITLHIDGGPGFDKLGQPFSINMGAGPLDGGDQVGESGTSSSGLAEVVYFGTPSLAVPGLNTRAFQDVKDNYFGVNDKDGRELAFHYALFVDYTGLRKDSAGNQTWSVANATATSLISAAPLPSKIKYGDVVKIIGGTGAGQDATVSSVAIPTNLVNLVQNWTTIPNATSTFVVLDGSSGTAEEFFYPNPDNNSLPANDLMVAMGSLGTFGIGTDGVLGTPCSQWRTLEHELGHNLGLRHGGTDQNAHKGNAYLSLMNYDFSDQCKTESTVQSYSGAGDPTFNDWGNLQHDFLDVAFHLGNSLHLGYGAVPEDQEQVPELTGLDYVIQNGPPDNTAPTLTITSPAANAKVGLTLPLQVVVNATDNNQVASVTVAFDGNGNGAADKGELVTAKLTSANTYKANFAALSGPTGARTVTVSALDSTGNSATVKETVNVIVPNPAPSLTSLSPSSAAHGGATFTLTINGANFVSGAYAQFNGANRSTTFVNSGKLTVKIPASDIATAGTANVTVKNPAPGGGTSNSLPFTIN
jgi:hypothetical protein